MPHANPAVEQIARAIEELPRMLERDLVGFDDRTRVAQAPGLPNHLIWTLGHLALYHHRAAERVLAIEPGPLPERDFVTGDGRAGDAQRFDTESVCFDSAPVADASLYPTLARGVEIHAAAAARLAASIRERGDAVFTDAVTWGAGRVTQTSARLAIRMSRHAGTHAGQLLDLRRALGMPRILA